MKQRSKFLSLVLRHDPESIGVKLDAAGWVDVDTLLRQAKLHGQSFSVDELKALVAQSDKQRFTLSGDGTRIRAAQGHSVPVDLGLEPMQPPAELFHGTATRSLEAIRLEGLMPQARQQVHLSANVETAIQVGQRHGKAHVFRVDTERMQRDGIVFFRADNGVWLTDTVPPQYLEDVKT